MKLKEIQELVDWLIERGITEFELTQRGTKIRIHRGSLVQAPQGIAALPPVAAAPLAATAPAPAAPSSELAPEAGVTQVTSPIVGTFYRKPNPSAENYVEVGDKVTKGQTLCIVEAMKVMNEIDSTVSGVVTAIHIEESNPVEYGEALFSIKTS